MLKTILKVALAPVYVPYKACKKVGEAIDSLSEPMYWPDHLPQNDPPSDDNKRDD